jgi:large-conductance mechanosensitive channel
MAKQGTKAIIEASVAIVVGLAMFPVVQSFVNAINFSLTLGASTYDLGFAGFILQLLYLLGVAFAGYKIWDINK